MTQQTLDDFRASFDDIARQNRFQVFFYGPAMDRYASGSERDKMHFWCSKAVIPKVDITGPEIKFLGTKRNLTGDPKFENLSLTFWNVIESGLGLSPRTLFERWISDLVRFDYEVNDVVTEKNRRLDLDEYRSFGDIEVEQHDNFRDVIAKYYFRNCVPLVLSSIELEHASADSLGEFTVEFQFENWYRSD